MDKPQKPGRIEALDYLRGYFIIVIVIDHVYRWPSFLAAFTGQGLLWANAADGFLIISGLLVGYIRGFKERLKPFQDVAVKLAKRALMLYGWAVGLSILYYFLYWSFTYRADMPDASTPMYDWVRLLPDLITLVQAHTWIYYLHLYALFMLFAIAIIALLRHHLAWLAVLISLAAMGVGTHLGIEWLQKQTLFILPAVIGFYLDDVQLWVRARSRQQIRYLRTGIYIVAGSTLALAAAATFFPQLLHADLLRLLAQIFTRTPISLATLIIAFVWFIGLFTLFNDLLPLLKKYVGWLVLPFGTRSLAAYIVHAVPLFILSYFIAIDTNIWLNTLLGILSILATWWLVRQPWLLRILPK